jgi:zinc protease
MRPRPRLAGIAATMLIILSVQACVPAGPAPAPADANASARAVPQAAGLTRAGDAAIVKLDNGLTVIIRPMHTAPVVCVRSFVHTGGIYEGPWLGCGVSHLCEHLVAKSEDEQTNLEAPDGMAASREVRSDIGGQSNASTSMDITQYYISASAGKAMQCIDLVAAWMARPNITKPDFEREHGVVQRELELGKDDPDRQMWYAHAADVFRGHPAAVPIIGFAGPLAGLTYQDIIQYHDLTYVPQNMVFVVAGDVEVEAALDRVRKAFAGFKAGREPRHNLPEVAPLAGVIRTVMGHPELKETMQEMSFRTVALLNDELCPLDVLDGILSSGQNSRLVAKLLRRQRLVTNISASSFTPDWGKGMFNVSFRCAPDKADEAEKAVLAELALVAERGVDAAELDRAKRQIIAGFVYQQQSVESVSHQLGSDYISTGDANFSKSYTRRIEAVSAEQVQAAARKYFTPDRMVVTRMVPAGTLPAIGAAAAASASSKTVTLKLPNGLRAVLTSTDAVDLVSMALVAKGGLMVEDASTNGLGEMMASLSTKGAGDQTAEQIADFFANAGGSISGSCGNNSTYWQASVLSGSFDEALSILADVVQRPTFPEKELDILRPRQLAAIDRVDEDWSPQLMAKFRGEFFKGSPLALLPEGGKDVVAKATVEQIRQHHRKYVRGGDSVLAIFGKFDADAAAERVKKLFADLPGGTVDVKIPPAPKVPDDGKQVVMKTEKNIAAVIVAVAGMTVDNADRFPLNVLDTIISGYRLPSGWLHTELRGKQLVYVVHAYNWPALAPGAFITYAAGEPAKAPEILRIIDKNLRKASNYTPTEAEIKRAVNTILTADVLGNQSMSSLAMTAATDELFGFGYDFRNKLEGIYAKITPADVAAVGKKYLSGGYFTVVTTPQPELVEKTKETK